MPGLSGKTGLILSTTSSINLMTVSSEITREHEQRILEANSDQEEFSQNTFRVAKLELAFLLSKDSVSFRSENITSERNYNSASIYTLVQVKIKCYYLKK